MERHGESIDGLLTGARVFTGDTIVEADVAVRAGRIAALLPPGTTPPAGLRERRLPADSLLTPGFIDTQVNGGGGVLFNETPDPETLRIMAAAHRRFGTTALLPTFITDEPDRMRRAVSAAVTMAGTPGTGIIGIHLEGPFLSVERKGVHKADFIRPMTADDRVFLLDLPARFGADHRVLLSLAPEKVTLDDLRALAGSGLILSGAHSMASYETAQAAIAAGLRGFTHLFNAMPPPMGREPGIVGAALLAPDAWCGIIADGIHVHPAMLKLALAVKPAGTLMLVTDAMTPTGTDLTHFPLYGETIHRRDGRLITTDGTLAGADIDMAQAVRNCVTLLELPLEEALRMASLYPARFLRLDDRMGRIAPGYRADLALLDSQLTVTGTWVAGIWQPTVTG